MWLYKKKKKKRQDHGMHILCFSYVSMALNYNYLKYSFKQVIGHEKVMKNN